MAASFIGTAALISMAAPAQVIRGHNTNAPVEFDAGELVLNDRADRVTLTGNAVVRQAGLTISASRLTAAYTSGGKINVNRFDAVGGVRINKDDLQATSNAAIYDVDNALITLIGNVKLTQGSNRLNGGRIVIDLNADRTTITGGAASQNAAGEPVTGGNGRVTGTFSVPQRSSNSKN